MSFSFCFICSPPSPSYSDQVGVVALSRRIKQQLFIHSRCRQRAPNLNTRDRALLGFMSIFLAPRRIARAAIIIKPSTLLHFLNALKKRRYRLLYSPRGGSKPGPKGPSQEVINAIVEMKQRNPRYGCPRITHQINLVFGLELDKDTVRIGTSNTAQYFRSIVTWRYPEYRCCEIQSPGGRTWVILVHGARRQGSKNSKMALMLCESLSS